MFLTARGAEFIAAAVADFRAVRASSTATHRDELATINHELKGISTTVDRYLYAC